MAVDKSLSRGLADGVLADYEKEAAEVYFALLRNVRLRFPDKRADVRAIVNAMVHAGEGAKLSVVAANHPKWRWAAVANIIPIAVDPEARATFGSNRATRFHMFLAQIHAGKQPIPNSRSVPLLELREHAIERLFQRLNSMDQEAVRDEIHDAVCLAASMLAGARILGLKQTVLPTASGAFLCSLTDTPGLICAKTWVPSHGTNMRIEGAAKAISDCYNGIGGPRLLAETIGSLPYGEQVTEYHFLLPELQQVLGAFPWFLEEYERGVDLDAEVWKGARAQVFNA